jgi:hypothetical protein
VHAVTSAGHPRPDAAPVGGLVGMPLTAG